VITCAASRDEAEQVAEQFWADTQLTMVNDSMTTAKVA
jgi:hypothetical protein